MDDKYLVRKVAELGNMNVMILFLLLAFLALSIGFAFYFLVAGPVGFGIGVTMFVVASLFFIIGEIYYFSKMKRIEEM